MAHLVLSEWLAIVTIAIAMIGLTVVALSDDEPTIPTTRKPPFSATPQTISVTIDGMVSSPGRYELARGTTFGELLSLAKPLSEADLRRFKTTTLLTNGRQITIPPRPHITIYLSGAVEKGGPYRIPKGTTLRQLNTLVPLAPDADSSTLDVGRRVKEGESIDIPTRKNPPLQKHAAGEESPAPEMDLERRAF